MSLSERYEPLEVIARGAMGVVYRARERGSGEVVAIKQVAGYEDPEECERFLREAEAVSRLRHPHIVELHAYGRDGGQPYLVLQHLAGETLTERVHRRGALTPPEALGFGEALASALAHAHKQGVLHRDLKPDNVMVVEGRPYLIDFGLARFAGSESHLTATRELLGTPSYMPPEQARGARSEVGPWSDVYGLCATLYFALTGRPPLLGPTVIETLRMAAEVVPQAAQSGWPVLDKLLAKGLAKDPRKRPPSAQALARACAEARADPEGSQAPEKTSKGRLLALGVVFAFLLGGGASALLHALREPAQASGSAARDSAARDSAGDSAARDSVAGDAASEGRVKTPLLPVEPKLDPLSRPKLKPKPKPLIPLTTPERAVDQIRERASALRLRQAISLWRRARERWPQHEDLRVWTGGWLQAQVGAWEGARAAFQEGERLDPKRLARLCRLPGDANLRPFGRNLRELARAEGNPLPLKTRWTPWLGGRWQTDSSPLKAQGVGFGPYNLSVVLDERAPAAPRSVEVEMNLDPGGRTGYSFAGILVAGRAASDFFCVYLASVGDEPLFKRYGGIRGYTKRHGAPPVFARVAQVHDGVWRFRLAYSKVATQRRGWQHLRVSFQGTRMKLFIGGVEVGDLDLGREAKGRWGLLKFYEVPILFRGWSLR